MNNENANKDTVLSIDRKRLTLRIPKKGKMCEKNIH